MIFSRSAATIDSLDNVRITRDGPHTTLSVSDGQNITEMHIHDRIKAELIYALIRDEVQPALDKWLGGMPVELLQNLGLRVPALDKWLGGMPVELLQNLGLRVKGVTTDA